MQVDEDVVSLVSATLAADGTPRAREPYQDASGNWTCRSCGRAHGFKSKHAVLGHLRACRPGKPAHNSQSVSRGLSANDSDSISIIRATIMAIKSSPEAAAVLAEVSIRALANLEQAIQRQTQRAEQAEQDRDGLRAHAEAGATNAEAFEQTIDGEADPSAAGPILAAYATDKISVVRAKELLMYWQQGASRQAILDLLPNKGVLDFRPSKDVGHE